MTGVLVCGGGSGGHVYPALAMLEAFGAHPAVGRVGFVGTPRAVDRRVFGNRGDIAFFVNRARHFRGNWSQRVAALGWLGLGLGQAFAALARLRPSLIVGTGGYASVPVLLAGLGVGIPTAVFEPNATPGLANRLLGPYVDHVFCGTQTALPFSHPRVCETGIPLRRSIARTRRTEALYRRWGLDPGKRTLLVLGGSLGAQRLNELAMDLARRSDRLQIVLSLGAQAAARPAPAAPRHLKCVDYIERMDEALALADVAVCRAGALTLAELSASGVPAIVVPWEGAADGHHLHNARAHAARGAGVVLRECELNPNTVIEALNRVLHPDRWPVMRRACLALGRRHLGAGARMVKEVERYLDGKVSLRRHRRRWHERVGQGVLATAPSASRLQH